jgi:hypothetical protein
MLVLLAIVGGVRFIGSALHVRELSRVLHRAQTLVWVAALGSALAFVVGLLDYRMAQVAGTVLGVLCMCVTLPAALMRARRGDRAAWVVTAGWALYEVGAFTMALLLRGQLPFNVWTDHALQAGSAVEMLTWLVVLSLRVHEIRQHAHRVHAERDVMRSLAESDALTGLPNRRGLRHHLEAMTQDSSGERWAPSTWSTSMASRPSTTAWATTRATCCSTRWPSGCATACAPATPWRGWAATSW